MREIELKAHVADPGRVRRALSGFMEFQSDFDKRDEQWSLGLAAAGGGRQFAFRVRAEAEQSIVTYKEKTYRDGMEVNEEIEFALEGRKSFLAFLGKMGARRLYSKRKKGSLWRLAGGIQAELAEVEGLGYFLEVELLVEDSIAPRLDKIKSDLLDVVLRCGLEEKDIEPRPYSQLLGYSGF